MSQTDRQAVEARETSESRPLPADAQSFTLPDLRRLKAEATVLFGAPEWQAHLGGGFLGVENTNGLRFQWVGGGTCWCVLPSLQHSTDYAVRFEAAPFVPYKSELRELSAEMNGTPLFRMIVPVGREEQSASVKVPLDHLLCESPPTPARDAAVKFTWRKLPAPRILVSVNRAPLADLCYEPEDTLQPREFLLRQEYLESEMVLYFSANFSLTRREIDGAPDDRQLSFRFFRLLLYPLLPQAVSS